MSTVIVQYKVKPDAADKNVAYVKAVFEQLKANSPAGLRYASFVGDDGVSFVHIASIETDDGSNPLAQMSAFKAFTADIKDRCDEPPRPMAVTAVGAYRAFE